jgi:hypothetical protein
VLWGKGGRDEVIGVSIKDWVSWTVLRGVWGTNDAEAEEEDNIGKGAHSSRLGAVLLHAPDPSKESLSKSSSTVFSNINFYNSHFELI